MIFLKNNKFLIIFLFLLLLFFYQKILHIQAQSQPQITSLTSSTGACYIKLNWECIGNCQTPYTLYRSQNSTMYPREIFTTTDSFYEFTNLDFNTSFYFQIKASNTPIFPSNVPIFVQNKSLAPPSLAPYFNQVTYNNNNFTLYFTTSTFQDINYGRYEIEYASSSNLTFNNFLKLDNIPAYLNQNFYSPTFSLKENTFYNFKIKAVQSGYGCRLDQEQQTDYNEILILPAPTDFYLNFNFDPNSSERFILNWNYPNVSLTNSFFEIYRKEEGFDYSLRATTTLNQKEFKEYQNQNLKDNTVYYYKIRACYKNNDLVFCSPFSEEKRIKNVNALQNFKILYLDYKNFNITFSWQNPFAGFGTRNHVITQIELDDNNNIVLNNSTTYIIASDEENITFSTQLKPNFRTGKRFKFYANTYFGGYPTANSNEIYLDLTNLNPIKGWAWSNINLGWLRLSNDSLLEHSSWQTTERSGGMPITQSLSIDNISYGLYFVSTTKKLPNLTNLPNNFVGYIIGQAWSPYYGWIYFENYNNEQCPNLGEPCLAYVVKNNTGMLEVKGWARFENLKDENGYSWLSLSKKTGELLSDNLGYGLYLFKNNDLADFHYYLRGLSWHSNFGWVSFGGPILKKVVNKGINPQTKKAIVEVEWMNLVNYENVIRISAKGENYLGFQEVNSFEDCKGRDRNYCKRGNTRTEIKNLEPNLNYKIKISGY